VRGPEYIDDIRPAVEIEQVHVREDGRVLIEALAADRSGIDSVGLFCDGQSVGRVDKPPYAWAHRPGEG
jgi:hypothetical protein